MNTNESIEQLKAAVREQMRLSDPIELRGEVVRKIEEIERLKGDVKAAVREQMRLSDTIIELSDEVVKLQQEIEKERQARRDATTMLDERKKTIDTMQKNIVDKDAVIVQMSIEIDDYKQAAQRQDVEIERLDAEIARMTTDKDDETERRTRLVGEDNEDKS